METAEFQKMLNGNPELAQSLKEALEGNAGVGELSGKLIDAGVDAATAEAILAECQLKRGNAIGAQELDDEELDHVAGGEDCTVTSYCDNNASHCHYMTACEQSYTCIVDNKSEIKKFFS